MSSASGKTVVARALDWRISQQSGMLSAFKRRPCFPLLQNEPADWVDAVKIDVEGSEDRILVPFFRNAPRSLWPKLLVIEDAGGAWSIDLFSHLTATGYAIAARSKQNVIFRLKSTPS